MGKKGTEIALSSSTDTQEVLELLSAELKGLKEITDRPYKTTGNLDMGGSTMDIKTETKVENLIRAFSSVQGRSDAYAKSAKALGVNTYPVFQVSGGSVEDWEQDIKLRLDVIQYDSRKQTLQSYQDRMSKFLSEADQRAILMKEMSQFLKGAK